MNQYRILVCSDSHGTIDPILQAVRQHQPHHLIHLGDIQSDLHRLADHLPQLSITGVPGNWDCPTTQPLCQELMIFQTKILLSHGHLWGVKLGYHRAMEAARSCHAHILLFGHTHRPYCRQQEDGLWVMNPGSSQRGIGLICWQDDILSSLTLHSTLPSPLCHSSTER